MGQTLCPSRRGSDNASPDDTRSPAASNAYKSNGSTRKEESFDAEGRSAEEWKIIGNAAVKDQSYAKGYDAYSRGLKADPDHAMILSNRALCLEKLGRLDDAVEDAKRCMALRPDFAKGFLRAATILTELKRYQEALSALNKAPKGPDVDQMIAKVKVDFEKAEKSRLASAGQVEKLKEEGNALFKQGLIEKALDVYKKALKSSKDTKGEVALAVRNNMAGCYQQLSDFPNVVQETNFVLEHQPDNCKALLRRMIALEPLEKYEQALADARRVIQLAPGNEQANKTQHRLGKLVRDREREGKGA